MQAAGRNLTDAEQKTFDAKIADARHAAEEIRKVKTDEVLYRQAKALADEVGLPLTAECSTSTLGRPYGTTWSKSATDIVQTASRGLGV